MQLNEIDESSVRNLKTDKLPVFGCEKHQLQFDDLPLRNQHIKIDHFPENMNQEEKDKVIYHTSQLTELFGLSDRECEIIYRTYLGINQIIRNKIHNKRKGGVYFPAKYSVTLLKAFRADQFLRARHIIEYKDMRKVWHQLLFTKNTRAINYTLQLVEFEYRKSKYGLEEYCELFWNVLISADFFVAQLMIMKVTASQYKTLLIKFLESIENNYPSFHHSIYCKSKLSFVVNLFILLYEIITSYLIMTYGQENRSNRFLKEHELRQMIAQELIVQKTVKGITGSKAKLNMERRYNYDYKFELLEKLIKKDIQNVHEIIDLSLRN